MLKRITHNACAFPANAETFSKMIYNKIKKRKEKKYFQFADLNMRTCTKSSNNRSNGSFIGSYVLMVETGVKKVRALERTRIKCRRGMPEILFTVGDGKSKTDTRRRVLIDSLCYKMSRGHYRDGLTFYVVAQ